MEYDLMMTLNKKWFELILSGIKKEEYREIKDYWTIRFQNCFGKNDFLFSEQKKVIAFKNGYQKTARQFSAECSIRIDTGREEWGAEQNKIYYVLTIHRIFDVLNCD